MKSQKQTLYVMLSLSLIAFTVLLIGGCESSKDEEASASLKVAYVTASPSTVEVGGSSIIEAQLTNNGEPLADRLVTFSVPSAYGSVNPTVDTSDADGMVATVFTATQSGSAIVTVTLSDNAFNAVTVTVQSSGGGGQVSGNIDIAASPVFLIADGSDSSLVTVTVRDASGGLAPDGIVVKLTAGEKFDDIDGNGYYTPGVDEVVYDVNSNGQWDPNGTISSTVAVSGGAGQATTYYHAGTYASTVYIKATVSEPGYIGFNETSIQLNPDATIASIVLFADSIHLAVKGTGGLETSHLRAIGYDLNGNKVPEGLQVSFIITDGPDTTADGEHLGNLTGVNKRGPYVTTTNNLGVASCPISSGTISGTIRIRAYTGSIMSNATQIMVHAGPPARIAVAAEVCNVQYWGWVNKTNGIVALVSDIHNNPVADSTVVYFTCDEGVIKAHEARTQGENGLAFSEWMSYGPDAAADGDVIIIAETSGGTLADSSVFINSWYPDTMWYTAFPASMYADGKSKGFLFVEVRDLNFNYVIGLDKVKLEGDFVSFVERENGDGCFSSGVSAYIVPEILDQDYSMTGGQDDGVGASTVITARYGFSAGASQTLLLLTGTTYTDNSIIDIVNTAGPSETIPFSVTIIDRWGNPLGDHTVVCSVSGGGSVTNGTQNTNTYGEASGYVLTTPAVGGVTITVQAQDTDPRGLVTLTQSVTIE